MANSFTFNQIATILNQIQQDAQGRSGNSTPVARNTADFVTQATTVLSGGTDPIMASLTQLIAKTVFSVRPYRGKLRLLDRDNLAYGNTVRKVTPIFTDSAVTQPMFNDQPADGSSTDHWTIKRPKVLQTLFTGMEQYMVQAPTVFEEQLRSAFRGPEELGDFITSQATAVQNELNQQKETLARNTVANLIGAKNIVDPGNVLHVLTMYNTETGLSLTATDVFQPANFSAFVQWFYALVERYSGYLEERTVKFHMALTGYTILRHTPKRDQRLLMYAPLMQQIKTMSLAGLYHESLLKMDVAESLNFWQDFEYPSRISVTPSYTTAAGAVTTGAAQNIDPIMAVLFDKEAMGINTNLERAMSTPINAKGLYYNTFYHFAKRYYNDLTENAIVFLLD